MVVNEFENMEASFSSTEKNENIVRKYLMSAWCKILELLLDNVIKIN